MAKQVTLTARPRVENGRNAVKRVRSRGSVPAVIYGHHTKPANLEVSHRDLEVILSHAVGENILADLQIEEGGKTTSQLSLIQEVQHHISKPEILHVDFHAVSATEKISAEVAIESFGEADGVKNYGGLLEHSIRSLSIRCLPQNLPEIIRVDVSALKVGESIHVRDLQLPEGVEASVDCDLTVFLIAEPKVADEAPTAGASSPEVLKEKKAEAKK